MKPTPSQQLAIETQGCTLLISAAAGSGKTATLTKRIISKLIGDGEHPGADLSRMLVVTFTKAAAAELKSRIGDALTAAIAEHPGNKHLSKQLLNLGSAKICTIDSFYTEPVRTHFAELGIPPQLTLADESDVAPLRREIAHELSEQFFADMKKDNGNAFADLLNHVCSKKNVGACSDVLLKIYDDLTRDVGYAGKLKAAAASLQKEADDQTPIFDTAAGQLLARQLTAFLTDAVAYLRRASVVSAETDTAKKPDYLCYDDDHAFYTGLLNALPKVSYDAFVAQWKDHEFPTFAPKKADQKTKTVETLRAGRKKLKSVYDSFTDVLCFTEKEIQEQSAKQAAALSVFAAWIDAFDTAYRTAKEQNGICEFNDMRYYMMKLLLNPDGTPTDFAGEISGNYDEVYIDEYQDVDAAQDAVFAAIGGNHRFMVGDIKQCIYAFRGSRPDIFAGYRQKMSVLNEAGSAPTDVGGSIFMSENFRCNKPIIDFSNMVCDLIFPVCGETVNYQAQDRLVCGKKQAGITPQPVSVVLFAKPKKNTDEDAADESVDETCSDAETTWIANEIQRLLQTGKKDDGSRILPQDIAVLARTAAPLAAMEDELKRRGIAVLFDRNGLDAKAEGETRLLLSVLQVIDNPENDTALEEVLSIVFSFDPIDLVALRRGADKKFSLFRALCLATDKNAEIADETQEKCRTFLTWLRTQQHAVINVSTDVFIRRLWRDDRLQPYTAADSATVIYNDARSRVKTNVRGFHWFVTHLAREVENNTLVQWKTDAAAVNLLTEHKSKGLEFPVCFVINCGHTFSNLSAMSSFVWHSGKDTSVGIKLFRRDVETAAVSHEKTLAYQMTLAEKKTAEKQEEMRLLYVAMTRAREKLYLTGSVSSPDDCKAAAQVAADGNATLLMTANKTIEWILAAMAGREDDGTFIFSEPKAEAAIETENAAEVPGACAAVNQPAASDTEQQAPPAKDFWTQHYAAANDAWTSFVYPDEEMQKMPTKLAASAAAPDFVDTLLQRDNVQAVCAETNEWNDLSLHWLHDTEMALNGLTELNDVPKKASAAEKGTALHAFLQFCDWHAIANDGMLSEIDRLVEQGYLADTDADMILQDKDTIGAVENGELMPLVLSAADVKREVKFHRNLPLADFTQDKALQEQYGEHTIFLQGSIDLLLTMKDGTLTLVDYKTDRILAEQNEAEDVYVARITERHKMQLQLYADAIEQIYGQRPTKTFLYAIPVKKLIPVSV